MTVEPPAWATAVPSAPVTQQVQPSAAGYQMTQLSSQQVAALQQQLLESIWQGFLKIVDGFLLPDTAASDQLAAWWTDLQSQFNQINASLQQNWLNFQNLATRITSDLLITADVFHFVYNAGTPSDPPGTLGVGGVGPGKPTWYSAWNDLLELFGVVNSVAPPTDPAPTIGTAITTGNTNTGLFLQYSRILADIFHLTYPAGSPTDTPTTTIGGKPTWYSAWNGLLVLEGLVKSTTAPTDAANAAAALGTMQNTVTTLSSQVQTIQTTQGGQAQSNAAYAIDFSVYPNGAWPSTDFPVSYTGTGTSTLAISGGNAVVQPGSGGNVTAISRYLNPTNTDFQVLSATIAGLPQGNAKTYACVRMNTAMDTYVYAGITVAGFSLNWEIGCFVAGTQHVFTTGSGAPLNLSFELKAGVGGDPYRFQGISGNTIVFDYTDSSHVSTVGSSNRYFGFKSITDNNGAYVPAPGSYLGCFDNSPAGTLGSGYRQYRASTSNVTHSTTQGAIQSFASGFFDTNDRGTADITAATNSVTITNAGWYDFTLRIAMNNFSASLGMVTIAGAVIQNGVMKQIIPGNGVAFNIAGAQDCTSGFGGTVSVYCASGDTLAPGYYINGIGTASALSLTGDANGYGTYWSVTLANKSLA